MKMIITESKLINIIKNYILGGYPVVKNVTFITKDVYSESERKTIQKNIIVIGLISGQMTHSPSWTMKEIRNDINRVFSLDIDKYGSDSDWGIDYKISSLTGQKDT
jgi:hypothetical protein